MLAKELSTKEINKIPFFLLGGGEEDHNSLNDRLHCLNLKKKSSRGNYKNAWLNNLKCASESPSVSLYTPPSASILTKVEKTTTHKHKPERQMCRASWYPGTEPMSTTDM